MKVGPPLSPEEVESLPDGTEVEVIWSGGNGPHRYRIVRVAGGGGSSPSVCVDNLYEDPLSFVGPGPPYTVVREVRR